DRVFVATAPSRGYRQPRSVASCLHGATDRLARLHSVLRRGFDVAPGSTTPTTLTLVHLARAGCNLPRSMTFLVAHDPRPLAGGARPSRRHALAAGCLPPARLPASGRLEPRAVRDARARGWRPTSRRLGRGRTYGVGPALSARPPAGAGAGFHDPRALGRRAG